MRSTIPWENSETTGEGRNNRDGKTNQREGRDERQTTKREKTLNLPAMTLGFAARVRRNVARGSLLLQRG